MHAQLLENARKLRITGDDARETYSLSLLIELKRKLTLCLIDSFDKHDVLRSLERHQRELLSGDRGAFQNGSARTRSDADAAHMSKASGIMQMRQTRQMQIDEDACIRN